MRRLKIKRKYWPLIILAVAIFVYFGQQRGWITPDLPAVVQPGFYHVAFAVDGDTIVVDTPGGQETVRFIGVDTPETHDPRKPVQCYGPEAAAFTKAEVQGKQVKLVADPLDTDRDRYDRLLRYVYLPDGTLLNLKLIQTGRGFYYPYFPFSKKVDFALAEKGAQLKSVGLWANCRPTPTNSGGYTSNPISN